MKYNFEQDVLNWSIDTITRLGHRAKDSNNILLSLSQVFTIARHLIIPVPRKVKISKGFICPDKYIKGFNQIITEIRSGKDLSPRGSRQQNNIDIHVDSMLIDWGISHLHLGTELIKKGKNKGLIQGYKEIIFVFFTDDCAYIIDIYDHKSWTRSDILLKVKNNWPELIEPYRIEGAFDLSRDISASDRQLLRENNINSPIKIDEYIYFGPGGGISCTGIGIKEIEIANIILRSIDDLSKWFVENELEIKNKISEYIPNVDHVIFIFEVSKFVLSRTFTVKSKDEKFRVHLPSIHEPASLIHESIANIIEPNKDKHSFDLSIMNKLVVEIYR